MRTAPRSAALVGAVIAAIVTLPGLGIGTLWDNSETAYGEVAREILLYHDPVVMHFDGAPWFVQPPLYFWLAALCAKVLGVGSLAMRLPSAVATIAMGAVTAYATCRIAGQRAGIVAAVVVSTNVMQAIVGRLAIMDALLDLCVTAAIFAFFESLQPEDWRLSLERRRSGAWYWGWIAVAAGVLAKGPVALAIPALVIVPWAIWEGRDGRVLTLPSPRMWLQGIACFTAIVAPWFVLLQLRVGTVGVVELIGHYTFGRYLGTIEGQTGPVWYYVPALILGFFPWIAFVPAAAAAALGASLRDRDGALGRLALLWSVLPFLFFSFAQTKLPNYVALEIPGLAVLVALWFERASDGRDRAPAVASGAVLPAALAAVAVAVGVFSGQHRFDTVLLAISRDVVVLGAVMGAGALLTFVLLLRTPWVARAPFALGGATAAALLLIALVVEPRVEPFKPIPALAAAIDRDRRPADAVVVRGVAGANALLFYTAPVVDMLGPSEDPRRALCGARRAFYVGPVNDETPDPPGGSRRLVETSGKDALYLFEGASC